MRLAGEIPVEVLQLIAAVDTSDWPSIKDPKKAPANYRYDDHMQKIVPSIPARLKKA